MKSCQRAGDYFIKIIFLPFIFCIIDSGFSFSQNPDIKRTYHWYFGSQAGLDFSGGAPVADINGQTQTLASCSSVSDTFGNLLFYSAYVTVWNRNHQVMPNGTGLNTHANGMMLIVPQPLNDSLYYIFTTRVNPAPYTGLLYSIVNMKLDGGLGDVTVKNDTILQTATDRVAAVRHANGVDVWIITTEMFTNKIYCYLLTSSGLSTTPIVNSIGNPDNQFVGYIKFSPSGKKFAIAVNSQGSEIFDFDNATGILSNPILFPSGAWQDAGVEFSPDETKLYFTRWTGNPPSMLYQVDLSAGTPAAIVNSLTLIDTAYELAAIQRASDGRLYLANYASQASQSLGAINAPNVLGMGCNFVDSAVFLNGGICATGLPLFMSSYFYDSTLLAVTNIPGRDDKIICYPNPFNYTTDIIIPSPLIVSEIDMIDLLGRKTEVKKKITKENDKTVITLKRNNLSAGIYFLNIKTNNNIYSQKLIITN